MAGAGDSHTLARALEAERAERAQLLQERDCEIAALRAELDSIHRDGLAWVLAANTQPARRFSFLHPVSEDLISVVIPAYNAAEFLRRCVGSVWDQRGVGARIEVLLSEDGSSDGTYELALELAAQSPMSVAVLTHPDRSNRGVSASRNLGLRHARGRYVALLDADDVWLPDRLAVGLDYLQRHPNVRAVCSYGYNRDLEGNLVVGWNGTPVAGDFRQVPAPHAFHPPYTFDQLLRGDPVVNSTLLIHREAIAVTGGYPDVMAHQAEDWLLLTKLSLLAPIELIDRQLIDYTVHAGSYTSRYVTDQLAYGVQVEFLYHLVHWMVLHPDYHDRGLQVFRAHYPRLLANSRGSGQVIEEYYRRREEAAASVVDFESHLTGLYAELEGLRAYHHRMDGHVRRLLRIPGVMTAVRTFQKLRAHARRG